MSDICDETLALNRTSWRLDERGSTHRTAALQLPADRVERGSVPRQTSRPSALVAATKESPEDGRVASSSRPAGGRSTGPPGRARLSARAVANGL